MRAALLADRVTGVVCLAGLAPFSQDEDWFAGMRSDGALRAAAAGREARARFAEAAEAGGDGLIDDDVAFVTRWGFDLTDIGAPVLVVHGGRDRVVPRAHVDWLVRDIRRAELWYRHAGYFRPDEVDALLEEVRGADVSHAPGVLRGFVARYAR